MRVIAALGVLLVVALGLYVVLDLDGLARWAAGEQRAFQNRMATAVRGLQVGEAGALTALFTAAAAYGFFHAAGPGHGKVLIGGVGLGSSVTARRLLAISVVSSLAQALWAVALVYGGFLVLEVSARRMTDLAEDYLAPVSHAAIALIGVVLVWRGLRGWVRSVGGQAGRHDDDHAHCRGHSHGPTPDEIGRLTSWRETAALVGSIAIRPCTGAMFLLVIAWQMDFRMSGAVAVVIMGLGTAVFTSLVAVSSVVARTMAVVSADRFNAVSHLLSGVQVLAGVLVVWFSLTLLAYAV